MGIKLGTINLGWARDSVNWFADLTRYKNVRFIGWGCGRLFIGVLIGSKDGGGLWALRPRNQVDEWEARDRSEVRPL